MKIIAFTGMPASGKSEAVQLARDKKIPVLRMGDLVWEETRRQGKPLDDKNVGEIASNMRQKYGMDIWAKRAIEKIKFLKKTSYLIIDGIRNVEEIEYFKKNLNQDFFVVAINASEKLRRERVIARGRIDDSKNPKNLKERDKREISWGLQKVIVDADITILNNGSLEQFKKKVLNLLNNL